MLAFFFRHMPRSWRLAILKAAAWPEFDVRQMRLEPAPDSPIGCKVGFIPLSEVPAADGRDRALMAAYFET